MQSVNTGEEYMKMTLHSFKLTLKTWTSGLKRFQQGNHSLAIAVILQTQTDDS